MPASEVAKSGTAAADEATAGTPPSRETARAATTIFDVKVSSNLQGSVYNVVNTLCIDPNTRCAALSRSGTRTR
ncbi:hypothetical protein GCM10017774_34210 [Lentzea cavernae]|uniref:Uncharacterized protein n=1 Tax=Lentzea cavernae TaxID=2020703 RepID=A0ABQ3MF61_9PSEU|nr:hypothetical protein GCM10017774_34210 [Lentzea cavernae]